MVLLTLRVLARPTCSRFATLATTWAFAFGSRRDADAPYPKSGLTFNLHLSSNTIPLLFNFLAIISREDEVQECFYSAGSFAFSIHVLITPYRIFAVVSIVKSRLYAVDSNCCNVFVIYEVGQSNITDSAFVILYALQQSAGIISFQRFVGCFFSTAQSELLEESAVPLVAGRVIRTIGSSGPPTCFQLVTLAVKMSVS